MPLGPGIRLGPYEVISAVGAGGMGEVYRACDTKLNRDVALKIPPPAFAADPDRLARFHREAQVLASLASEHQRHLPVEEGPAEAGPHVYKPHSAAVRAAPRFAAVRDRPGSRG